ncbi:MAG: hypothetical protein U0736_21040 [Gemmataceae bacterium]
MELMFIADDVHPSPPSPRRRTRSPCSTATMPSYSRRTELRTDLLTFDTVKRRQRRPRPVRRHHRPSRTTPDLIVLTNPRRSQRYAGGQSVNLFRRSLLRRWSCRRGRR